MRDMAKRDLELLLKKCDARLEELGSEYPVKPGFKEWADFKGFTRRDFLKWSAFMSATMMLPPVFGKRVAMAAEIAARQPVVWLHFAECTGCTESLLRSDNPGIADLILQFLSLEYHDTVMAPSGVAAEKSLTDAVARYKGKYICICEGSIPTAMGGNYLRLGPKAVTGLERAREVTKDAAAVISVGHCASYGGPQASYPNPTGSKSINDALGISSVIIPGCPYNSVSLVGTILYFILFGGLPKTKGGRPLFAYGKRIHDTCTRRSHYDAGEFVRAWGDESAKKGFCLYKMGCKGPLTYNNCNLPGWNDGISGPIRSGHGCIGCSEPAFWDVMAPLEKPVESRMLPGVEALADNVGWTLLGTALAGMGAHAAYSHFKAKSMNNCGCDDESSKNEHKDS